MPGLPQKCTLAEPEIDAVFRAFQAISAYRTQRARPSVPKQTTGQTTLAPGAVYASALLHKIIWHLAQRKRDFVRVQ